MELFNYQKKVVRESPDRWGIWLDVGLGKTAIAITLARTRDCKNVLVVTTKSLVNNWKLEINLWDSKHKEYDRTYVVLSKEQFKKLVDRIPECDCVIFDEFHNFAYYTNAFHKTAKKFLLKNKPQYIWGLTATPILSSVMSVWGLSLLLSKPLGSFLSFQNKYFHKINMGGRMVPIQKKHIEEDIAFELRKIGTVISKETVLDLPETVHDFEYFELTDRQQIEIEKLDDDPTTITPIVYHTKCLQIANGTLKINDFDYREIESDKMDRVLEIVAENPSCVVVCRQTAELEILHDKIKNSFIYNGATSVEKRDEIIRKVNGGGYTLLLQADMGIGFNLTGISLMIFYSHSWDFVKYYQCLGRIHRIGQKNQCRYLHLITKDTIDENVWKCLERKESFDVEMYHRQKTTSLPSSQS